MVECLCNTRIIFCQEEFSENYRLTLDEVFSYAYKIGINCETEPSLLPIAVDGLIHPLPSDWIPCYDQIRNHYFYFNLKLGTSQWEHPVDKYYVRLVQKLKYSDESSKHFFLNNLSLSKILWENKIMLPLRPTNKPHLIPIKELLKRKEENPLLDENKQFGVDQDLKRVSYDQKSVIFGKNKYKILPKKDTTVLIKKNFTSDQWNEESNSLKHDIDRVYNFYDHQYHNGSNNNNKLESSYLSNDRIDEKINDSVNIVPSMIDKKEIINEFSARNNLKSLQINLRPDVILSENYNEPQNTSSNSSISEPIADQKSASRSSLKNAMESAIGSNLVTPFSKNERNLGLNNQNQINVLSKTILDSVNGLIKEDIINIEKNLYSKLETKITNELFNFKKMSRENLKPNNSHNKDSDNSLNIQEEKKLEADVIDYMNEKFLYFQNKMDQTIEEKFSPFIEYKRNYDLEIKKLICNPTEYTNTVVNGENYDHYVNALENKLRISFEECLKIFEQSIEKHLHQIEIRSKREMEKFKFEKNHFLSEVHQKFQTFLNEFENEGKLIICIRKELQNLFSLNKNEIANKNSIISFMEQVFTEVLKSDKNFSNLASSGNLILRSVASQTENYNIEQDKIDEMKEKIENMALLINNVFQLVQDIKKTTKSNKTFVTPDETNLNFSTVINNDVKEKQTSNLDFYSLHSRVNVAETSSKSNDFINNIDAELEHYRRKYIWNSKWPIKKKK